jgi:uncharacterized protein YebE (UPF0316 family)
MQTLDTLFAGAWGPVLIFCLRIVDVSLATLRMLLVVRGRRIPVPIIGFFEVLIWVVAVGSAIRNLHSGWHLLGYAGGFATGNVVGLWIEEKLAFGLATVRVISRRPGLGLAGKLRERGFGATEFAGHGREGPVAVTYTVVKRRQIPGVMRLIDQEDPGAFVTVEEPKSIRRGWLFSSRRK